MGGAYEDDVEEALPDAKKHIEVCHRAIMSLGHNVTRS